MAAPSKTLALALIGVGLLGFGVAKADSMRCSGLHAACVADCRKASNAGSLAACLTNCSQRRGACLRTGCWNSGTQTICDLLRQ